ncbi:hypothetical protein ACQJBY_005332 [Aegilops geniculata]
MISRQYSLGAASHQHHAHTAGGCWSERRTRTATSGTNAPNILCYQCNSCKAGVMEQVRQDWHKISVLNVIVLVFLICICACGCCAFRNARRSVSEYPYGVNRMSKINPRWDYYWWRWFHDRREQMY